MTPSVRGSEERAELRSLALRVLGVLLLADGREDEPLVDEALIAGPLLEDAALDGLGRDVLHHDDEPAFGVVGLRPRRASQVADTLAGQPALVVDRRRRAARGVHAVEHRGRGDAGIGQDGRKRTTEDAELTAPGEPHERGVRELDDVLGPAGERDPDRSRLDRPLEERRGHERLGIGSRRHHGLAFDGGH